MQKERLGLRGIVWHDHVIMKTIFEPLPRLPTLAVAAAASVPMALPVEDAAADSFCANIDRLVAEVPNDFSGVTLKFEGASDCTVRSLLHGKSYHCTWDFPHRDDEAYETFENIRQKLEDCLDDNAIRSDDQDVNHPDFYDARIFQLGEVKLAVSVKDKSMLGATFVFFSVAPLKGG